MKRMRLILSMIPSKYTMLIYRERESEESHYNRRRAGWNVCCNCSCRKRPFGFIIREK